MTGLPEGIKGEKELAKIEFQVAALPGQGTDVVFEQTNLGDQHGNPIDAETENAKLSSIPSGTTPAPTPASGHGYYADVNCDSAVNVSDALLVLEHVALGAGGSKAAVDCPAIGS